MYKKVQGTHVLLKKSEAHRLCMNRFGVVTSPKVAGHVVTGNPVMNHMDWQNANEPEDE